MYYLVSECMMTTYISFVHCCMIEIHQVGNDLQYKLLSRIEAHILPNVCRNIATQYIVFKRPAEPSSITYIYLIQLHFVFYISFCRLIMEGFLQSLETRKTRKTWRDTAVENIMGQVSELFISS